MPETSEKIGPVLAERMAATPDDEIIDGYVVCKIIKCVNPQFVFDQISHMVDGVEFVHHGSQARTARLAVTHLTPTQVRALAELPEIVIMGIED
jgi:hypothetical protein